MVGSAGTVHPLLPSEEGESTGTTFSIGENRVYMASETDDEKVESGDNVSGVGATEAVVSTFDTETGAECDKDLCSAGVRDRVKQY